MTTPKRRIAINIGGRYVPGLNGVIAGTVLAANELGWEVVGIRDGFDGLLFPDRYPDGGVVTLTPQAVTGLISVPGVVLGTASRTDPFHDDEEHIRAVLAFIRPYPNVIKYELLPYHRYGETKYGFLGRIYELEDFNSLNPETLHRLQAIIDEAFGRGANPAPDAGGSKNEGG